MSIDSILKIIEPPPTPSEAGDIDGWKRVEEIMKTKLPIDYKQYISTYGTGCICEFLWPLNPFSKNKYLNLMAKSEAELNSLRDLKKMDFQECPYPLFPDSGGILTWGVTDNGDVLFWLTQGEPDKWITVINESRSPVYEEFDRTMTQFISDLIRGQIRSNIIELKTDFKIFKSK